VNKNLDVKGKTVEFVWSQENESCFHSGNEEE